MTVGLMQKIIFKQCVKLTTQFYLLVYLMLLMFLKLYLIGQHPWLRVIVCMIRTFHTYLPYIIFMFYLRVSTLFAVLIILSKAYINDGVS